MNIAIITAAGSGKRMNSPHKKQFMEINDRPVLTWTIEKFIDHPDIDAIVLVLPEEDISGYILAPSDPEKIRLVPGGEKRPDSVKNGLKAAGEIFANSDIDNDDRIVLIHDGVRPLVTGKLISSVIDAAGDKGNAIPIVDLPDTLIRLNDDSQVMEYPPRSRFKAVQTPQGFSFDLINRLFLETEDYRKYTDESSMLFEHGIPVNWIEGDRTNIKITTPDDMIFAGLLLKKYNE